MGLDWDEGPFRQSDRFPIYNEFTERLLATGAAYFCDCDPQDLEERRKAALARGDKPRYDGRCRDRGLAAAPNRAVRFKTPKTGTTFWQDQIKGHIAFENQELDDLVIRRADGIPTYNLAVVVDDITMEVTHIIRGDDHISNTPRQILIYQALGATPPLFGHMPLMLGKDRTKLSKRHGALPVLAYRDRGILPHTLNNYLARLGWSHGDQEIFSREELIEYFSLHQVGKAPGVHDDEKLLWLNSHYIKTSDDHDLARELIPFLAPLGIASPDLDYVARVAATLKTRRQDPGGDGRGREVLLPGPPALRREGRQEISHPGRHPHLRSAMQAIEDLPSLNEATLTGLLAGPGRQVWREDGGRGPAAPGGPHRPHRQPQPDRRHRPAR